MNHRKATAADIPAVTQIYEQAHDGVVQGTVFTGWQRGVYPARATAEAALSRGDLFVAEDDDGTILGTAIINRIQVDVYEGAPWRHPAADDAVMVLHTLVIPPRAMGRGLGTGFVGFYERYALENGCRELRMDTNVINAPARALYKKLGYEEITVVQPKSFNGLEGISLVLLEKYLAG